MVKMKKYLSNKRAQEYILFLAQHGNHYINYPFNSINDVRSYYKQMGIDANEEISKTREYGYNPKKLTNILDGNWHISSAGTTVKTSVKDAKTNEEIAVLNGSGAIVIGNHWNKIISSRNSFDKAMGMGDVNLLNEAIAQAIFAIEAYINQKAHEYNKYHDKKLIDDKKNRVILEDKLIDWTEIITERKVIDKGDAMWEFFKKAINIRDQDVVHQKCTIFTVSKSDFIHIIKIYRKGALAILQMFIKAFDEKEIPFKVIETLFYPELERG